MPELVYQQDEPIGDPACLPMHFLSRAARKDGVIVVLVGEGSDEVFGGYDRHGAHARSRVRRAGSACAACRGWCAPGCTRRAASCDAPAGRTDVLRRARDGQPLYWGLDVVFWDNEKDELLTPEFRRRLGERPKSQAGMLVDSIYADLKARQPNADLLQQMSVRGALQPAAGAAAHARRQDVDGALDRGARAVPGSRRWCRTGCRCRAR